MGDKVLVTGASGFIAQHVIVRLLAKGYDVRGTVRSKAKGEALKTSLAPHAPRIDEMELAEADLSSDAGWDAAAAGCAFVQHIASPLPTSLPKSDDELIIPARDGALRVLKAAKAAGAKRVVMTSSMAAVAYGWGDKRPALLDESHWSKPAGPDNTAYTRSKTIAERAAWDYARGEGAPLDLVCLNPGAVLGPALTREVSASLEVVIQPMQKKLPAVPNVGFAVVDVRDVADAHITAMTAPGAGGERFLLANEFMWFAEVCDILREAYPNRGIPKGRLPDWGLKLAANFNPTLKQIIPELGRKRAVSHEKAKASLGFEPIAGREAVLAAAKSLIDLGVV
ncbi:NAD-dependent epimerase/dehydratase family protein [bacterium]|nr:NAD-dependent epimerase/dehydratase family protein [bacterium]